MKSYGQFKIDVKVPHGDDAVQKANEVILLIREEIITPTQFMEDLEDIMIGVAKFLDCRLELTEEDGLLVANFNFKFKYLTT